MTKPKRKLFASLDKISASALEDGIEKLGLEHFIFPNSLLLSGLFAAFIVFLCEICIHKCKNNNI